MLFLYLTRSTNFVSTSAGFSVPAMWWRETTPRSQRWRSVAYRRAQWRRRPADLRAAAMKTLALESVKIGVGRLGSLPCARRISRAISVSSPPLALPMTSASCD